MSIEVVDGGKLFIAALHLTGEGFFLEVTFFVSF